MNPNFNVMLLLLIIDVPTFQIHWISHSLNRRRLFFNAQVMCMSKLTCPCLTSVSDMFSLRMEQACSDFICDTLICPH